MVIKLQTTRVLVSDFGCVSSDKIDICLKRGACFRDWRLECFLKATYELQYLLENKLKTARCRKAIFRK